ncbi:hypothetical protein ACVITL_000731 [Rhizobium pisi]
MSALLAIVSRDADYYLMLSYILRGAGYRTVLVDVPNDAATTAKERGASAHAPDCRGEEQRLQAEWYSAGVRRSPRGALDERFGRNAIVRGEKDFVNRMPLSAAGAASI